MNHCDAQWKFVSEEQIAIEKGKNDGETIINKNGRKRNGYCFDVVTILSEYFLEPFHSVLVHMTFI